jgi:hypothetical protein
LGDLSQGLSCQWFFFNLLCNDVYKAINFLFFESFQLQIIRKNTLQHGFWKLETIVYLDGLMTLMISGVVIVCVLHFFFYLKTSSLFIFPFSNPLYCLYSSVWASIKRQSTFYWLFFKTQNHESKCERKRKSKNLCSLAFYWRENFAYSYYGKDSF